jgi:hypothetical protein
MRKGIDRRQLGIAITAAAGVLQNKLQGQAAEAAPPADDTSRAKQRAKRTSETLDKIALPYDLEPQSRFEVI